jgi:uridine phosphorylase
MMRSEIVLANDRVYHLGLPPQVLAPNLILVGDPQRAYRVAEKFDTINEEFRNREYLTICGRYRGIPCSVIGTGIGTDNVEIAIVEAYGLLCLDLGFNTTLYRPSDIKLIRVGTSGGISSDVPSGTLVISKYAVGLDSTGLYYDVPITDPIIPKLESTVHQALDTHLPNTSRFKGKIFPYGAKSSLLLSNLMFHKANDRQARAATGITVSTSGFYGPSGRHINGLTASLPDLKEILAGIEIDGLKILNMEMESSLIFHLCGHLGIESSTICPTISAAVEDTELVDYGKLIDLSIDIALETLLEVSI